LAAWAGVGLTHINALRVTVMMKLLSGVGPDVSRFATARRFCSWLGLCSGANIIDGKVLSSGTQRSAKRAQQVLKLVEQSLSQSGSRRPGLPDQSRTDDDVRSAICILGP
jgi:transposase